MKSNLVLATVTDKNGVMTKRWVKPTPTGAVSALSIPPVQPAAPISPLYGVSRSTLLHDLYKAFNEYGDHHEYDIDEITEILKKSDDHTLRIATSFVINEGDFDSERIVVAADILQAYQDSVHTVNEMLTYHGAFSEEAFNALREDTIMKLRKCAEIPYAEDYSLVDEKTQTEVRRLLRSAGEHYSGTYDPEDPSHNIIIGEKMRELLHDNANDEEVLGRINKIMIERQTEDPVLIQSILNSETSAISSGIL